jgi:hypothetical protein
LAPQVEPASNAKTAPTLELAGASPEPGPGKPAAKPAGTAPKPVKKASAPKPVKKASAAGPVKNASAAGPPPREASPRARAVASAQAGAAVTPPGSHPAAHGRRYKRREIELAEGGKLVLNGDGSISRLDAAGEVTGSWATDDPDWARHGIRFGLRPEPATVAPHGRRTADPRPLGG